MRKVLQNFLVLFLLLNAIPCVAQESRGILSVSSTSNSQFEANKLPATLSKFDAGQNSPNPFSEYTQIEFTNPAPGFVEFKVVNLLGKEVFQRVVESEAGRNSIRFEADDFLPGVYIYSLSNGSQTITRRMVISKK